ncbi:copper resistance CopC/CopD family protein [Nakamurella endophytica]|uniref:copper resistance CopC/CopD family protein n=1 Tax=Nakamurella endophytica TaxID=1748367 RepID=UPI00166E60E6|nr:copper resistance protein CopC [Nakamurella endophytica]
MVAAVPASAHATLLETTPGDTSVVRTAPLEVDLRYDQPVSTALGAVRVLDPGGNRVDSGTVAQRDDGRIVVAALKPDLPHGTYTVLWRVLSADAHTIFGASTFSVGAPSSTSVADQELEQDDGGRAAEIGLEASRVLSYGGIVLLFGVLAFVALLWPAGRQRRAVRRLVDIGWWATVAGTVTGVLLQGPYASGRPLSAAVDPDVLGQVLATRFGLAAVARLVLLLGIGYVMRRSRHGRGAGASSVLAGLGLAVLVSISVVGHSGSSDLAALALPLDVLHMAAASVWLGGLTVLATVLLRRPDPATSDDLARVLPRWSATAAGCVLVLVASGAFAGWRQIREWGALTGTGYGRLLIVKFGLVAGMVLFGALGRQLIQRRILHPAPGAVEPATEAEPLLLATGTDTATLVTTSEKPAQLSAAVRILRRSVLFEAVLAAAVLVVAAILVGTAPARDSYVPTFTASAPATSSLTVDVSVAPAKSGLNDLQLTYTGPGGRPTDVVAATARWTQQGGGDAVVPVTLTRSGPGRYTITRVALPAAGQWQLAVTTQSSDIDSSTVLFDVRVR